VIVRPLEEIERDSYRRAMEKERELSIERWVELEIRRMERNYLLGKCKVKEYDALLGYQRDKVRFMITERVIPFTSLIESFFEERVKRVETPEKEEIPLPQSFDIKPTVFRIMSALISVKEDGTVSISLENIDPTKRDTMRYWVWNKVNNRISIDYPLREWNGQWYPKYPIRDSKMKDVTLDLAQLVIQFIAMKNRLRVKINPLESDNVTCKNCRHCRWLKGSDRIIGDAEAEVPSLSPGDVREKGDYVSQIACAITGEDPLESGGKLRNKDYLSALWIRSKSFYDRRTEREVANFCPNFRDRQDAAAIRYKFTPVGNGKFMSNAPGYSVIIG
jgi:hypothetical protein